MELLRASYEIETPLNGIEILKHIEKCGRTCYKSEDKITYGSTSKFCKMLIDKGHTSVIEHFSVSVRIVANRATINELIRHRLASYSQESTRYCNYKGGVKYIIPIWCAERIMPGIYDEPLPKGLLCSVAESRWLLNAWACEQDYLNLLKEGWPAQQARDVLPQSLKTEIVMTCNLREWRWVFRKRWDQTAHPSMREIMVPLLEDFKKQIPVLFEDVKCAI